MVKYGRIQKNIGEIGVRMKKVTLKKSDFRAFATRANNQKQSLYSSYVS